MDYGSQWPAPQPPPAHHASAAQIYSAPDQATAHNSFHAPQPQEHYAASHPYDASAQAAQYSAAYAYDAPAAQYSTYPSASADSQYYYHSDSAPNPNPSSASAAAAAETHPARDPYPPGWYEGFIAAAHLYHQAAPPPPPAGGAGGPASYYGVEAAQSFALKAAVRQFGVDPSYFRSDVARSSGGPVPTAPSHVRPAYSNANLKNPPFGNDVKRGLKGKGKQTAFCEVCKIDCTTQEVLMNHKQGKKHKKNLQKLQESITPKPPKAPTATTMTQKEVPTLDKGKAVGEQTKKRMVPATAEELEAKKRRLLEGGAAAEGVRVCTVCNVVVNSQQVFEFHIAGQMHAALAKKQQARQQTAPAI